MIAQRLTIETIDESVANECFTVLSTYGNADMPRFTHNPDTSSFIVSHAIPCVSGNRPLDNVLAFVAKNIGRIIYFTSEPE